MAVILLNQGKLADVSSLSMRPPLVTLLNTLLNSPAGNFYIREGNIRLPIYSGHCRAISV